MVYNTVQCELKCIHTGRRIHQIMLLSIFKTFNGNLGHLYFIHLSHRKCNKPSNNTHCGLHRETRH